MKGWILGGIIVAVIVVVVAVVVPCMIPSGLGPNEASAVASIMAINQAEEAYRDIYGRYATSLTNLGGAEPCRRSAESACLLDDKLASGTKSGYRFAIAGGRAAKGVSAGYVVGAAPERFARSGVRLFCSTEKDVIRVDRNDGGSTTTPGFEECERFSALR